MEDDWVAGPASRAGFSGQPHSEVGVFETQLDDIVEEGNDEEEEEDEDGELQSLRAASLSQHASCDAHLALIAALRARGDRVQQLRQARIRFTQSFPLAPKVWRQWIADEARGKDMNTDTEARAFVCKLCEDSLNDFIDVGVWITYIELVARVSPCDESDEEDDEDDDDDDDDDEDDDMDDQKRAEIRALFDRAVTTAGLHYSQGARLWRMYRSWERSHALPSEKGTRVASIYRRQLALPLNGNEEALEGYRSTVPLEDLDKLNSIGVELKIKCQPHEVAIAAIAGATVAATAADGKGGLVGKWKAYAVMLSKECREVPLALSVYERAVAMGPTQAGLWEAYVYFTSREIKDAALSLKVATRAVRNCPSVLGLHLWKMKAIERCGGSVGDLEAAKDQALLAAMSSADEAACGGEDGVAQVLLAHLDFLRRALSQSWGASPTPDVQTVVSLVQRLRTAFAFAHTFLAQVATVQRRFELFRYECSVEEDIISDINGGDVSAARAVLESCMGAVGSSEVGAQAWLFYAAFEHRQEDDPGNERAVFKRAWAAALSSLGAGREQGRSDVGAAWLLFERARGSLDSFEEASERTAAASAELKKRSVQLDDPLPSFPAPMARPPKKRPAATDAQFSAVSEPMLPQQAKRARMATPESTTQAAEVVDSEDVTSLPDSAKRAPSENFESNASVQAVDETEDSSKDTTILSPSIFVTNLPFDTSEEEIQAAFVERGAEVVSVVLLKNKANRFRGMATVELSSPEAASSTQSAFPEFSLRERTIQLSIASLAPKKTAAKSASDSPETEVIRKWPVHPTTVFVKGFAEEVRDEELAAMFACCGRVACARVLFDKNQKGVSRQEGLVQFQEVAAVSAALGMSGVHGAVVEPSRFPAEKAQKKPLKKNPYLASSKEPATEKPKNRLQKTPPTPPTSSQAPASTSSQAPASSELVDGKTKPQPKFSFLPRALRK